MGRLLLAVVVAVGGGSLLGGLCWTWLSDALHDWIPRIPVMSYGTGVELAFKLSVIGIIGGIFSAAVYALANSR